MNIVFSSLFQRWLGWPSMAVLVNKRQQMPREDQITVTITLLKDICITHSRKPKLITRVISFELTTHMPTVHQSQTDRRTDRRMDDLR